MKQIKIDKRNFKDMTNQELGSFLNNEHQCEEYDCTICLSAWNELKRRREDKHDNNKRRSIFVSQT